MLCRVEVSVWRVEFMVGQEVRERGVVEGEVVFWG